MLPSSKSYLDILKSQYHIGDVMVESFKLAIEMERLDATCILLKTDIRKAEHRINELESGDTYNDGLIMKDQEVL